MYKFGVSESEERVKAMDKETTRFTEPRPDACGRMGGVCETLNMTTRHTSRPNGEAGTATPRGDDQPISKTYDGLPGLASSPRPANASSTARSRSSISARNPSTITSSTASTLYADPAGIQNA